MAKTKTLSDCHHDAVVLAEMLEGIDLMGNEGATFDSARIAVTIAAMEWAQRLRDDLETLESPKKAEVAA